MSGYLEPTYRYSGKEDIFYIFRYRYIDCMGTMRILLEVYIILVKYHSSDCT